MPEQIIKVASDGNLPHLESLQGLYQSSDRLCQGLTSTAAKSRITLQSRPSFLSIKSDKLLRANKVNSESPNAASQSGLGLVSRNSLLKINYHHGSFNNDTAISRA